MRRTEAGFGRREGRKEGRKGGVCGYGYIERICFGEDDGFMGRFWRRGYPLSRTIKLLSLISTVGLHEGICTATVVDSSRSAASWSYTGFFRLYDLF